MKEEHIFAICAYKESAYLEACIHIHTEHIHRESVQ